MNNARIKAALAAGIVTTTVAVAGTASATPGPDGSDPDVLTGYEEVPTISTPGNGELFLSIAPAGDEIRYELSFRDLESEVTQAHIHFGRTATNGGVVVALCSNLDDAPAGTQACPPGGGTITGTIRPADVGGGAAAQGLAAGEFDELVRAIRAGATYVNVHTVERPEGEIRAQIDQGL